MINHEIKNTKKQKIKKKKLREQQNYLQKLDWKLHNAVVPYFKEIYSEELIEDDIQEIQKKEFTKIKEIKDMVIKLS